DEVPTRREEERDEPRPDPARVGANNGDEAPEEARASEHLLLGGSLIAIRVVGMGRFRLTGHGVQRAWRRLSPGDGPRPADGGGAGGGRRGPPRSGAHVGRRAPEDAPRPSGP